MSETLKASLDLLNGLFPGTAMLNTRQVAAALGKDTESGPFTIRTQINQGIFPIPVRKLNGIHLVSKIDMAKWMCGLLDDVAAKAKPTKGKNRQAFCEAVKINLRELSRQEALEEGDTLLAPFADVSLSPCPIKQI